MAATAKRKAAKAAAGGSASSIKWEEEIEGVIKELKGWTGAWNKDTATPLLQKLAGAVRAWEQAPIHAARCHVRAVKLESYSASKGADGRLVKLLLSCSRLDIRVAHFTREVGGPLDIWEDEHSGDIDIDSEEELAAVDYDDVSLDRCVDPRTEQLASLPPGIDFDQLESRLLPPRPPTEFDEPPLQDDPLWGPPGDKTFGFDRTGVWMERPRDPTGHLTYHMSLVVFWPRALERTLVCTGGVEPSLQLLEALLTQPPTAAPASEAGAKEAPQAAAKVPGLPAATRSGTAAPPSAKRPCDRPLGPSDGAPWLANQVLRFLTDQGPGGGAMPRMLCLLASPAGRSLGEAVAGPAACAALLDQVETLRGPRDAEALAGAAVAFASPGFDAALVRLVGRRGVQELGSCLQLAASAAMGPALRDDVTRAFLGAVTARGALKASHYGLVASLLSLAITSGGAVWQEHAEAGGGDEGGQLPGLHCRCAPGAGPSAGPQGPTAACAVVCGSGRWGSGGAGR
ncbi:hypothetical protein HYH03_010189 [Edaphochlamys debaryana]|uniref:Uncharacterized protein n=1 Tax=Edaphochlamys debaryana TaxID=47281 RepID=A0A836BXN2_9CHLO|nr:hypothetical protein HYH03_010189 [Edaphochlamys debaryana]|eukprot:KAG2491398.1 hypothetical protein HYH03_010189 [Edaphochlamys debaryana]